MKNAKKLLSFLLALCVVLSYVPVRALAEEGCPHHTCGVDCGYVETVEGKPCTHQCDETCKEQVIACVHVHSEEKGCVYTPAVEGVACDHNCANGDCGYVEAQDEVPCTCGAQAVHTAECASVVTEGAECD